MKAEGELVSCWTIDGRLLIFFNHFTDPLKGCLLYGDLNIRKRNIEVNNKPQIDKKGQYYLF